MRFILLNITFFFLSIHCYSQIYGVIKEVKKGKPIKHALVYNTNKTAGTYTNENGEFEIDINSNDTIIVKHVSFKKKIIVPKNDTIIVLLEYNKIKLKEVTVEADRKRKKLRSKVVSGIFNSSNVSHKIALKVIENELKLDGVRIFISKKGIPSSPFRLMLLNELTDSLNIFKGHIYEVENHKGGNWVEIFFNSSVKLNRPIFLAVENIYKSNNKYYSKFLKEYCNGIVIGVAKAKGYSEEFWINFNEAGWWKPKKNLVDMKIMLEPIWENKSSLTLYKPH